MTDDTAAGATVPRSIARVLDLFEIVLAERRCNLATTARAAGLTPTTALRYLRALEARGYVERDDGGHYSAGATFLRLAASARDGGPLDRLAATAQEHLDRLADRTGESAYLAVSDGRIGTYVAAAESPRAIRHVGWVGQDVTLDGSALGQALAEPGTVAARTGAIEPDITAMSLAMPPLGPLEVAISVVGPAHRFTEPVLAEVEAELTRAVERLGRALRVGSDGHRNDTTELLQAETSASASLGLQNAGG